ncbi:MAG: L,D-transpeptidase [Akkermansiaceae bacterium]|jgi:lipoprotein-anchoring transpeptidase ErfK/SrfK
MKSIFSLSNMLTAFAALTLSSCSSPKKAPTPNPDQKEIKTAQKVNPYAAGSYEHFKFKSYPYTTRTWKDRGLLAQASPSNTSVTIDLSMQRGFLMVGDQVAMDYRVSSGSSSHKTPSGSYKIVEKIKDKRSNLYGKVLNSSGGVVKSNADSRKDEVPEGGKFLGTSMAYWMRLTNTGIGMHRGDVNSRYASHGCIRSHYTAVPIVFSKTRIGTPVSIIP